jgi:hypothetical protein
MRHLFLLFATAIAPLAIAQETETAATLNEQLTSIATSTAATEEDQHFAASYSKHAGAEGCVAMVALFRHWPEKYHDSFCDFFRINPTIPVRALADAEINTRVNAILKQFKGRHALEIASRIYLAFRGTGFVAKRPDGSVLSLETMFRAGVFAGISGGSRDEVLRLAAIADEKALPYSK